jgi:hypothetical protein
MGHIAHRTAPSWINFGEIRTGEVRRTLLPLTLVNKGRNKRKCRGGYR